MQSIQRQEVKASLKHGSWEDWVVGGGQAQGAFQQRLLKEG